MGFLAKIGAWFSKAIPAVYNFVKRVAGFAADTAAIADAHLKGQDLLPFHDPGMRETENQAVVVARPTFMPTREEKHDVIADIESRLDQTKRQIQTLEQGTEDNTRKMMLHIRIMELIISSQTFERFINNIQIHASNLQIHLQTLRNMVGMLRNVDRHRLAIKALMQNFNHLINLVGAKMDRISGIDVNMEPGSISINDSYNAFINTKELILKELDAYLRAIKNQQNSADQIRKEARQIPGTGRQINH